jgi:hypothetical protein
MALLVVIEDCAVLVDVVPEDVAEAPIAVVDILTRPIDILNRKNGVGDTAKLVQYVDRIGQSANSRTRGSVPRVSQQAGRTRVRQDRIAMPNLVAVA